jgi:polyisoprenoid-binding protein YceI
MKRIVLTAALATLALASVASAAPAKFDFDPAHTEVGFNVRHIFSKVPGRFTEFSGVLMFDEKDFPASSVEFTIQSKSIDTNNDRRDNHLRSGDFFDVEKYPTLTFKSTRVTAPKNGRFTVEGDLTIRGVTRKVVLDAEFVGAGPFGMGGQAMGYKAGFEATTTVNRKDFGIVWNKALDSGGTLLGDDVNIVLHVEAQKVQ